MLDNPNHFDATYLDTLRDPSEPGINPDGLTEEQLEDLYRLLVFKPRDCAARLWPDRTSPVALGTVRKLTTYVHEAIDARAARLRGDIPAALVTERSAMRAYDSLPKFARW